jgi:hypothetical protein
MKIYSLQTMYNEIWNHGSSGQHLISNRTHHSSFTSQGSATQWQARKGHMLLTFWMASCSTILTLHHCFSKRNPAMAVHIWHKVYHMFNFTRLVYKRSLNVSVFFNSKITAFWTKLHLFRLHSGDLLLLYKEYYFSIVIFTQILEWFSCFMNWDNERASSADSSMKMKV